VDEADLAFLSVHWFTSNSTAPLYYCNGTDMNQGGVVDLFDYKQFTDQWLWCSDQPNPACDESLMP